MGRTRKASGRGLGIALAAAASIAMPGGTARTGEAGPDCTAINGGALNVALDAEATEIRQVVLKAGDKLTFSFEAGTAGPFGTLTLRHGTGAPRSLLVGPVGTSVSFVAAKGGAFGFEFSKEGEAAAAFAVSCVPAESARRHTREASSYSSRRSAKLLEGAVTNVDEFSAREMEGVILDAGIPPPSRRPAAPWASETPLASADPPVAGSALDMKLQWQEERYKPGPDGLQVDTTGSGLEAALKYKYLPEIMVGALAQVDRAGETLVGTPPALSDQGWMVGPVTTVKLPSGLSFDARAAWGAYGSDAAATSRRMLSARLANTQSFGPWRITPSVTMNHFHSDVPLPATETHDPAAAASASSGRVDIGPEFAYRIDLDRSAFIEPRAVIGSFWEIDSLTKLGPGSAGHGDPRLKAEAGVTIGTGDGTKLQAAGGVEEGAQGAADVWSGRLQLSVPIK